MKRFAAILSIVFALVVGLVFADSASAAGLRRGRSNCDCAPACASEPACAAAEPACCAAAPACASAEPACCAAEPACAAAEPACCAEQHRRGRLRGRHSSRRSSSGGNCCTSCCEEPACSA